MATMLASILDLAGRGDGSLGVHDTLTRGALATIIAGLVDDLPEVTGHGFADVSAGNPHTGAIARLFAAGIIRGYDDTTFGPWHPVTRGHGPARGRRSAAHRSRTNHARGPYPVLRSVPWTSRRTLNR